MKKALLFMITLLILLCSCTKTAVPTNGPTPAPTTEPEPPAEKRISFYGAGISYTYLGNLIEKVMK